MTPYTNHIKEIGEPLRLHIWCDWIRILSTTRNLWRFWGGSSQWPSDHHSRWSRCQVITIQAEINGPSSNSGMFDKLKPLGIAINGYKWNNYIEISMFHSWTSISNASNFRVLFPKKSSTAMVYHSTLIKTVPSGHCKGARVAIGIQSNPPKMSPKWCLDHEKLYHQQAPTKALLIHQLWGV